MLEVCKNPRTTIDAKAEVGFRFSPREEVSTSTHANQRVAKATHAHCAVQLRVGRARGIRSGSSAQSRYMRGEVGIVVFVVKTAEA